MIRLGSPRLPVVESVCRRRAFPVDRDGIVFNVLMAVVVVGFGYDGHPLGVSGRPYERVSDVAYCADHLFVLGAELGSQSPDVDIDGAGAAEEVMAPYFF
jgi:hypothetical protein